MTKKEIKKAGQLLVDESEAYSVVATSNPDQWYVIIQCGQKILRQLAQVQIYLIEKREAEKRLASPVKQKPTHKHLGTMNGWPSKYEDYPPEYIKCCKLKHRQIESKISNCYYSVRCDICNISWKYDSSG